MDFTRIVVIVLGITLFIFFVGMFLILNKSQKTIKSTKKNGVKVLATIKSIERKKERDKKNNVYNTEFVVMCTFEYNGSHEQKLFYNYELDYKKLKPGDQLECIYDPKQDYLTTADNLKSAKYLIIVPIVAILLIIGFPVVIGFLILKNMNFDGNMNFEETEFELSPNLFIALEYITGIILPIVLFVIWESIAYRMYDRYYKEGKYIKLKGKVVDIHVDYRTDDNAAGWEVYTPEIEFTYNNKKETYVSSRYSNVAKYKRGQEVIVFYNPEDNTIYEKGNNTFAIIMMIIGLAFLIPLVRTIFNI